MMPEWLPSMCAIQAANALWIAYAPALPKRLAARHVALDRRTRDGSAGHMRRVDGDQRAARAADGNRGDHAMGAAGEQLERRDRIGRVERLAEDAAAEGDGRVGAQVWALPRSRFPAAGCARGASFARVTRST